MKKITVLALMFVLLCAGVAYGGSEMIGKTVQGTFPVTVNGTQLSTEAIVIDGVSYLPTKAVAESLGATVEFKDNTVSVSTTGNTPATESTKGVSITSTETITKDDIKTLKPQSNSLEVAKGEDETFIIKDGNLYAPTHFWGSGNYLGIYNRENKTVPVTIDGNTITFQLGNEYLDGCSAFTYSGRGYINISALGLTYTIDGDTIWIETK